ncbi:MAG: hypothetical protein AUH72_16985 [Acidobacteria bacterium 13_1_40CM_4_65_8]|nr:MAG: hypothetical protein AUH72_16985 [Acidobacteria bacterium 13_1_40CM_4_65_8]
MIGARQKQQILRALPVPEGKTVSVSSSWPHEIVRHNPVVRIIAIVQMPVEFEHAVTERALQNDQDCESDLAGTAC